MDSGISSEGPFRKGADPAEFLVSIAAIRLELMGPDQGFRGLAVNQADEMLTFRLAPVKALAPLVIAIHDASLTLLEELSYKKTFISPTTGNKYLGWDATVAMEAKIHLRLLG